MKLVIDIPEEIYIHLLARYKYQNTDDIGLSELDKVGVSIKNGAPLPKGHGRLIDADRLTRAEIIPLWYHLPNGDIACPKIDIDHAPTIIEADKCTYKETGCGSCKRQLDCPIETEGSESE